MNPTLPPFVQNLFDRGVDPLDEPRTQEWLLAHPEALAAFAGLRQSLAQLPRQLPARCSPEQQRPRRWQPLAWLTAAAAALTFLLLPPGPTEQPATAQPSSLPRPDFAATGGVVSCVATATDVTPDRARQDVVSSLGRRTVEHYRCLPTANTRYIHAKTVHQQILLP